MEEHLPVLRGETTAGVLEKVHLVDVPQGSEADTGDGGPSHSGFIVMWDGGFYKQVTWMPAGESDERGMSLHVNCVITGPLWLLWG